MMNDWQEIFGNICNAKKEKKKLTVSDTHETPCYVNTVYVSENISSHHTMQIIPFTDRSFVFAVVR